MSSVFVKRYPSKGELPIIQGKEYLTDRGKMYDYVMHPNWGNIEYWLEEIELPSEKDIIEVAPKTRCVNQFWNGANFILNKLKGGVNEKD